jgi:Ca-activated chloride channel homolog
MRKTLFALLLFALAPLTAAEDSPLAVDLEPLGDTDAGVVARVSFRFPMPQDADTSEFYLQGSFLQNGTVIRNFRIPVIAERQAPVKTLQTFAEGNAEVEVRLIMPQEEDGMPLILQKTAKTFAIAKTNRAYVASEEDGAEAVIAEGIVPESAGAVKIRAPRRDVALNLFVVHVDVLPPVTRVEWLVNNKKVIARNTPPYSAELDLGNLPKRVEVRAVGYDARGRYIDADAFVVNERETPLEVKITRTTTPDGVSHFKLSIQNPAGTNIKTVALFAGDQKIQEWTRPPYAVDLPSSRLGNVEFVRASVVDSTGYEASDLLFLNGERYIEQIDVNLVELPVAVLNKNGAPIGDLRQEDFTILENGKPQSITNFNFAANLPISVGVLIDHSTSMDKRIDQAKSAAVSFIKNIMKKDDRAFIAGFASDPARSAVFVRDTNVLEEQVAALPKPAGSTALYDAIVTGLYRFRGLQGRKALIVVTDGEDTASRLEWDDMLEYARAARVPLYFIGIGIGPFGAGHRMKDLAEETGGVAYFVRGTTGLADTYKQLEQELRSQYLLSYHTQIARNDSAYRALEVKVNRPDAKVRTIRGFIP